MSCFTIINTLYASKFHINELYKIIIISPYVIVLMINKVNLFEYSIWKENAVLSFFTIVNTFIVSRYNINNLYKITIISPHVIVFIHDKVNIVENLI